MTVVGPTYPFRGGIAHYSTLLVQNLRKRHDVQFLSFSRQYPERLFPGRSQYDYSDQSITADCEYTIDSMNPLTWWRTARRAREHGSELLIFNWFHMFWAVQFWAVARAFKRGKGAPGRRVLFICHNVVPHEATPGTRLLSKLAFRQADLFVAHSEEDRQNLIGMIPGAKVAKSPHPTYDIFQFEEVDPDRARERFDLPEKVLLFFGFVREYKGLKVLLEAMPDVIRAFPDIVLMVVGEFWGGPADYEADIDRLELGDHVRIVDEYVPNEEVAWYFAAADAVVLPYLSATQSGIVQIAVGTGTPVVTTAVGGLAEAVRDGETGYVVEAGNPAALALAIMKFYDEGHVQEFADNMRLDAERFSWDRMVETIEKLAAGEAPGETGGKETAAGEREQIVRNRWQ